MANPWDNDPIVSTGPVYGPPPKPPAPRDPLAVQLDQLQIQQKQNDLQTQPLETEIKRMELAQKKKALESGVSPDAKVTEGERKGKSFFDRAREANESYEKTGVGARSITSNLIHEVAPSFQRQYLPEALGGDSSARQIADANQKAFVNAILRSDSGANAPPAEIQTYIDQFFPLPGETDPAVLEAKRQLRQQAIDGLRDTAGSLGVQPTEAPAPPGGDPGAAIQQDGQVAYDANLGGEQIAVTPNATKTIDNPALAGVRGEYLARIQRGDGPGEIVQFLRQAGVTDPKLLQTAVQQAQFRRKNPNVPIEKYNTSALDDMDVPLSATETMMNAAAQSAPGAYVMRAGNAVTGNNLDSIVGMTGGNEERARIALNDASQMHPVAGTVGDLSGGIMAAMGAEAGLARAGIAPGIGRALAADSAYGATAGAGANDGNRLQGAVQGGLAGLVGSAGGQAVTKGIASAVTPTGGRLADLYAAGVRPTPGQRFANSGLPGRMLNAAEEGLQSVPVVGAAIRGARQDARDQFQVGAFNQALREIGDELPRGTKPGPDAHKYANQKIGAVYDKAREGMRVMADEELANDIGTLGSEVGTLAEPSIKRFEQIIQNVVLRRTSDTIDGTSYKKIQSELGKIIRGIRKNPSGDGELADKLDQLRGAIDGAARRHSDPEAVAALDAADRAYAKLVRIEDASRRGGVAKDAGTFSPNDLSASVKGNDTRIRSKGYNQGEALMQNYAEQGQNLSDRMPNSGTADRLAIGASAAGGAAYIEPSSLGVLGVIGALYAPGMRKALAGSMAPRGGARAKAIAEAIAKRKRIAGASGATLAVQGTSPGQ